MSEVMERKHTAWINDNPPPRFPLELRRGFRSSYKVFRILYYLSLPLAWVWIPCAIIFGVIDKMIDNQVARLNRISMGVSALCALAAGMAMALLNIEIFFLHLPRMQTFTISSIVFPIWILLFMIANRCAERCIHNFCADMEKWED